MKNHILPAILLTICCIVFFSGVYTLVVWGVAQFAPNQGKGEVIAYIKDNPSRYGFTHVGQSFTDDGGADVHMLRNNGTVDAETIAVQFLPKDATRRIDMPDPGNCHF
jgi:K+-transporting ATPase c subunit